MNLTRREANLAVRLVRPTSGDVTLRRLGTPGYGLYGRPDCVSARTDHPDAASFERDDFVGEHGPPIEQAMEINQIRDRRSGRGSRLAGLHTEGSTDVLDGHGTISSLSCHAIRSVLRV